MGSLFKTNTPAPPPPQYNTYRDEVNGVEQVPVINADGTVSYVTRKIPLSPEQQARQAELEDIRQEALGEIKRLSGSSGEDAATAQSLTAWLNGRKQTLQDQVADRRSDEEAELARRGIGDSSTGDAIRRQRRLDEQRAEKDLLDQKDALGAEIRNQQLSLQQNLYNLAAGDLSSADARQYQAAIQSQSRAVSADAQRQASLLDYYTRSNTRESPFSVVARTTVGGVTGTAGGGFLGSWRWPF